MIVFRNMRRFKQQITEEECREVLRNAKRGVLSLLGEDGYPYGLPINHWYCEEDGKLYFHGAKEGHKIEAIRKCDKASFCAYDEGYRKEGEWALNIKVTGQSSCNKSKYNTIYSSRENIDVLYV